MEHLAEQRVLDLIGGANLDDAVHAHIDRCDDCRALVAVAMRSVALGSQASDTERVGETTTLPEVPAALRGERRPLLPEMIAEYRLIDLIGRGGMGSVYRAHDTLLDRDVAIKLIARASSEQARQRFLVEARAVARIRHANVVVVHRVAVDADRPYIVYDLVHGQPLSELRTPKPWFKALEIAVGIARGLAAAHATGVLHRDLKPQNVMIDERGDVVLVDFGLAELDGAHEAGVAGTPRYMAPEAWRGQAPTPQTDFYSFGVVLYELIAGQLPFADIAIADLPDHINTVDAPSLAQAAPWTPAVVGDLVDRCIARDPMKRPASASALLDELEAIQRGRAFETFERDRAQRVPHGNPYPGARAFGLEHQGVFFGRGTELRAVIDQLRTKPFVAIMGEPGVGKTSLCMAGVLPLVARGALAGSRKWVPLPMTVGDDPIGALAAAISGHVERDPTALPRLLRDDPDPVLAELRAGHRGGCTAHVLFVDKLEDLLHVSSDDARHFASLLGKLAEPTPAFRVLATLHTSAMTEVAQLPGLSTAIAPALFLLLEPRDRKDIIVEPARLAGRELPDDDVRALLALPLRELAPRLATLWERLEKG